VIGIKGVKMPKSCDECPCIDLTDHDEDVYCRAKTYEVKNIYGTTVIYPMLIPFREEQKGRQPWCPLVEIEEGEEKHGSLDDR